MSWVAHIRALCSEMLKRGAIFPVCLVFPVIDNKNTPLFFSNCCRTPAGIIQVKLKISLLKSVCISVFIETSDPARAAVAVPTPSLKPVSLHRTTASPSTCTDWFGSSHAPAPPLARCPSCVVGSVHQFTTMCQVR